MCTTLPWSMLFLSIQSQYAGERSALSRFGLAILPNQARSHSIILDFSQLLCDLLIDDAPRLPLQRCWLVSSPHLRQPPPAVEGSAFVADPLPATSPLHLRRRSPVGCPLWCVMSLLRLPPRDPSKWLSGWTPPRYPAVYPWDTLAWL